MKEIRGGCDAGAQAFAPGLVGTKIRACWAIKN